MSARKLHATFKLPLHIGQWYSYDFYAVRNGTLS